MTNPVLLAILLSASSLLFSLPFATTVSADSGISAKDTRNKALYSGNVLLVPPFQDPEEFDMIDGFEKGMRELSVNVGAGASLEKSRTYDFPLVPETPQVYTFTLAPRIGWILATYNRPRGALEFEFEPFFSRVKVPGGFTEEYGGTAMLAYNFETGTKLVPFVHAGAGVMQAGSKMLDVKEKGEDGDPLLKTRLNAVAQMGLGVKYFIRKRTSLNLEARLRHTSNPRESDEAGLNSLFFLVGLSYFY